MKIKIAIPIIAIFTIVMIGSFLLVVIYTRNHTGTLVEERMIGASHAAVAYMERMESYVVAASDLTAQSGRFAEYVQTNSIDEMRSYLQIRGEALNICGFIVTDAYGDIILKTHENEGHESADAYVTGIEKALGGEISVAYLSTYCTPMAVSATAPAYDEHGNILGTIVSVINMYNTDFVDMLSAAINAEVSVFLQGEHTVTTVLTETGQRDIYRRIDHDVMEYITATGSETYVIYPVNDIDHYIFYFPLLGFDDEVVGVLGVGFSMAQAQELEAELRLTLIIIGLTGIFIATALMILTLSRQLRPLERLTESVSILTDEDSKTDMVYGGDQSDEIGDLARTIQQMRDTLSARTGEIQITAEKLEDALTRAKVASKAKSDFLSTMSHEIRTPMTAVIGMTTVGKKVNSIEEKDLALDKISGAASHLLGIISDILDMAKIEADKLELVPEMYNFREMINRMQGLIRYQVDDKNQKFIVDIDEDIPTTVIGDAQRMSQVITNLLSNAVKFTSEGGTIQLNVVLDEMVGDNCQIRVEVIDDGTGISADQIDKLFDAFWRDRNRKKHAQSGTGLGLPITKRIVELMDGRIWAESQADVGTKFTFTAVLVRVESEDADNGEVAVGKNDEINIGAFKGKKLLIAEDIEVNREIMLSLLEDSGLIIDCAENGKEAVDMVSTSPDYYDIIFMDIQMPEMDGVEAAKRIRNLPDEKVKSLPIIALTANIFKDEIDAYIAAGMNDHLGKPIDITKVYEILHKYL